MTRVNTIAYDWYRDNPYSWKTNIGAWESTMHRTNVLICLRQAILTGLNVTTVPARYAWVNAALLNHAKFLTSTGAAPGTTAPTRASRCSASAARSAAPTTKTRAERFAAGITTSIDAQGSTNEQSTGYAAFNYTSGDARSQ